jgi:hypothetical protein
MRLPLVGRPQSFGRREMTNEELGPKNQDVCICRHRALAFNGMSWATLNRIPFVLLQFPKFVIPNC